MLAHSKKTFIFLLLLLIVISGLLFLRIYSRRQKPLLPPVPQVQLPLPQLPRESSLSSLTVSFSDNSPLVPLEAPYITATKPTITPAQAQQVATNLGIAAQITTVPDPVQGAFYRATTQKQTLRVIPQTAQLFYFDTPSPSLTPLFPQNELVHQILNSFWEKLPLEWQPQSTTILNRRFLKASGGEYLPADETTADILEVGFSTQPRPPQGKLIATTSVHTDSVIQLARGGAIKGLHFTLPLQLTPSSQSLPLKTKADIVAAFPQQASFTEPDLADISNLTHFSVTATELAYLLPLTTDTIIHPVFVLEGQLSTSQGTFPATALIPAIKSEFLSPR